MLWHGPAINCNRFGGNLKENQTWVKYYLVCNEVPPPRSCLYGHNWSLVFHPGHAFQEVCQPGLTSNHTGTFTFLSVRPLRGYIQPGK